MPAPDNRGINSAYPPEEYHKGDSGNDVIEQTSPSFAFPGIDEQGMRDTPECRAQSDCEGGIHQNKIVENTEAGKG